MPPASPVPGWSSGLVCTDSMATRRGSGRRAPEPSGRAPTASAGRTERSRVERGTAGSPVSGRRSVGTGAGRTQGGRRGWAQGRDTPIPAALNRRSSSPIPAPQPSAVASGCAAGARVSASVMRTRRRRKPLPLFSTLTTSRPPTARVEATCVPPSAWTSSPTMSTIRTTSRSGGSRLVAVRMMSGIANASARGSTSTRIARSAATSTAQAAATRSLKSGGSSARSKSIRAVSGSIDPPVTRAPKSRKTTPDSRCSAVWVRIRAVRRSSSTSARTAVPGGGTGSPSTGISSRSSPLRAPAIRVWTPPQSSTPWSGGWPPPPG